MVSQKNQWPEIIVELKSNYTISKDEVIVVGIEFLNKRFYAFIGHLQCFYHFSKLQLWQIWSMPKCTAHGATFQVRCIFQVAVQKYNKYDWRLPMNYILFSGTRRKINKKYTLNVTHQFIVAHSNGSLLPPSYCHRILFCLWLRST